MTTTLSKYWRVNLLVLLSGVFVLLPQYAQSASCSTAESFVEAYYNDLDRNDVASARAKWARPSRNLGRLVKNVKWVKDDIGVKTEKCTRRNAAICVFVNMKTYGKRDSEYWAGHIYLRSIHGNWKIRKMKLRKFSEEYVSGSFAADPPPPWHKMFCD